MNIFDRNGAFAAVGGTAVEAWDTATGKTPVLWTESALGAGVEQYAYESGCGGMSKKREMACGRHC